PLNFDGGPIKGNPGLTVPVINRISSFLWRFPPIHPRGLGWPLKGSAKLPKVVFTCRVFLRAHRLKSHLLQPLPEWLLPALPFGFSHLLGVVGHCRRPCIGTTSALPSTIRSISEASASKASFFSR